jgi:hypothetical protein
VTYPALVCQSHHDPHYRSNTAFADQAGTNLHEGINVGTYGSLIRASVFFKIGKRVKRRRHATRDQCQCSIQTGWALVTRTSSGLQKSSSTPRHHVDSSAKEWSKFSLANFATLYTVTCKKARPFKYLFLSLLGSATRTGQKNTLVPRISGRPTL